MKEGGGGAADQVESNRVTYELRNAPVLVFNMQHRLSRAQGSLMSLRISLRNCTFHELENHLLELNY